MLKTSAPDLKRGQGEAGEASIGHCADWAGMTEDRGQIPLLGSSSFCPQPQGTVKDREAWRAVVHGVAKNQIRLSD